MTDETSDKQGEKRENRRAQMIKGVLELALLSVLKERAQYGLEILHRLNDEVQLDVADGTIYPLLHRMEASGFVAAEWRIEGGNARPRKYYALTENGTAELETLWANWTDMRIRIDALLERNAR
jgi:PadR family transcriptional regulator, regulatory protein PadR